MAIKITIQRKDDDIHIGLQLSIPQGTPMLDCEEQILKALNEAGRLATRECLEQFDTDGSPIIVGGTKLTSKGRVGKNYQTPYGEIPLDRHVYQSSDGGQTFCPLDWQARIVNSTTPRFAKMCSLKYTLMNSSSVQMDLSQNHGRDVSRCYLQDITEDVSAIAAAKEGLWKYADPELPSTVATIGLGIDGTCMFYCLDGWRQAMVGTISLYDVLGVRMHTVYIGAPPEYGKERFYQLMEEEIEVYKDRYKGAEWVGLADGARDNWTWLKQWTDRLILDFWHAAGYLEKAGRILCPRNKDPTQWFEESRTCLKEKRGAAKRFLRQMEEALDSDPPRGSKRDELQAAITYFNNNLSKMDYARYQRDKLPIGSGVTEAACKTVVKQRMCGSGMKWKHSGATTVLRLRSLVLTKERWEQFWNKVSRYGF